MRRQGLKMDPQKEPKGLTLAIDMPDLKKFSTGFVGLDKATKGGLAIGSIVELAGEESDGKTTLGIQLLGKAQREGFKTLYLDAEHSTTKEYMRRLLDPALTYYNRPACAEEAFDKLREFWKVFEKVPNMVLIDSIAAMIPEGALEGEGRLAGLAAVLSKNIPTILRHYANSIVICTNQFRSEINTSGFGNPNATSTAGGWALKYYAGYRMELNTIKMITDSEKNQLGKQTRIDVVKNKFGAPFGVCTLDLIFGSGFSQIADLYETAVALGLIKISASWIEFEGTKVQGRQSFIERMKTDQVLFDGITKSCNSVIQKEA